MGCRLSKVSPDSVSDLGSGASVRGKFGDVPTLQAWLKKSGVNTEAWGIVAGSKPVGALLDELKSGEATLSTDCASPVRVVRVVNVRILSADRRRVLMQIKQADLPDGVAKDKRQSFMKKLRAGEDAADAIARGAEKLGGSAIVALPETQSEHVSLESASVTFPSLVSRYEVVVLDATVAEGVLPQTNFATEHDGKRYYWAWHPRLALPASLGRKLVAHDHSALWDEKQAAHMPGTREWAFAEVSEWLDDPSAPQLLWYMGGGGTGKSVLSAELLSRVFKRTAAWHFCRCVLQYCLHKCDPLPVSPPRLRIMADLSLLLWQAR